MKFLLAFVSIIACLNLTLIKAHPQQHGNRLADLKEALETQTDDMPPEIESPEFPHLMLKCLSPKEREIIDSCDKETELKLNTTKPSPIKSDASKAEKEESEKKAEKFGKLVCECLLKKYGVVDKLTNQFNMDEYIEGYKTTSLSLEQKTLASTELKSCLTANFTTPSLPLFIRLTESSTKENEVTGNWVSATHVISCDILVLIKNGCSDPSVHNSTLNWIIKDIQRDIETDLLHH